MISICRNHSANVKRWRDGQRALRWCAAGMLEAGKQFRRVNGHLHLRSLRDTLDRITEPVGATRQNKILKRCLMITGPHRSSTELGTSSVAVRSRIIGELKSAGLVYLPGGSSRLTA